MNSIKKRALPPLVVFSLVLLLGVVGCSKTGKATGKVTYGGKKVPVGTLTFHPEKGRGVPVEIDDGMYNAEKIPQGTVTVTVDTTTQRKTYENLKSNKGGGVGALPTAGGGTAPSMKDKNKEMKDRSGMPGINQEEMEKANKEVLEKYKDMIDIPQKFADPATSGLKYEIKSGTNEIDIEIPAGK